MEENIFKYLQAKCLPTIDLIMISVSSASNPEFCYHKQQTQLCLERGLVTKGNILQAVNLVTSNDPFTLTYYELADKHNVLGITFSE